MAETIDVIPISAKDPQSSLTITHVIYGLHALAPFTMLVLAVVAMIVGVVKRDDVRGTWLETHYTWLSRTFWWGLLWWVIAWIVFWVLTLGTLGIGLIFTWIFPLAVFVWYLYRVAVGWLKLGEGKPIG
ncbi:MAG: hypothetical protein ABL931_18290 [Usitatibacteraceae bacterium]